MRFPFASTGTTVSHFWHPPTQTTWNGTPPNGFVTNRWAWKLVCQPGPTLGSTGVPTLGTSMTVDLAGGGPNSTAIFAFGASNTQWGSVPLPLDLTGLNALGCNLLVSLDYQFLVRTDANCAFAFKLAVPNDQTLKGAKFYNQYATAAPGANGFGVLFTGGGVGTVN